MHSGGEALADGFAAAGWTVETIVVMTLHGTDVRGDTPPAEVRETGFDAVRALMEAWYRESMGDAEARDLADSDADSATRSGARYFLAERDGEPAAACELLGFGGIGQVESSLHRRGAPRPRAGKRGRPRRDRRGTRARRRPRDDPGRRLRLAQKLYERLGFETVDRYFNFTRKPPG